jgi:hypothetical protein
MDGVDGKGKTMLADRLVPIVQAAVARLQTMNNARPSEKALLREQFGDALLSSEVATLRAQIIARLKGDYCDDDDRQHYAVEDLKKTVLGANIFEATNEFENLF